MDSGNEICPRRLPLEPSFLGHFFGQPSLRHFFGIAFFFFDTWMCAVVLDPPPPLAAIAGRPKR